MDNEECVERDDESKEEINGSWIVGKTRKLCRWKGDPVFVDESGQYGFWCETWADVDGPHATLEICDKALGDYATHLMLTE